MRGSYRPDAGQGGLLEQLDRYPMTFGVIAANVLLFVFTLQRGGSLVEMHSDLLLSLGGSAYPLCLKEPWRLLTCAFLHAGPLHLVLNCIALFLVGRILEVHFGSARLWALYLLCCVGGSLASASWDAAATGHLPFAPGAVTVGASGGICGLILLGYTFSSAYPERLGTLARELRRWILIGAVFTILFPGIDRAGHVGGAVTGMLLGALVQPKPGEDLHPAWSAGAVVGGLVVLASFGAVVNVLRSTGI